jgi:ketosteroid isomerase-like protein
MAAKSPEEICRLFQQHMAAGDLDALVNLYDSEAVFLNQSGETKQGAAELREVLAPLAATQAKFEYHIRQIIQAGDIALMHTDWKTQSGVQYALEIARRQPDGTWRWLIGDPFTVGKRSR